MLHVGNHQPDKSRAQSDGFVFAFQGYIPAGCIEEGVFPAVIRQLHKAGVNDVALGPACCSRVAQVPCIQPCCHTHGNVCRQLYASGQGAKLHKKLVQALSVSLIQACAACQLFCIPEKVLIVPKPGPDARKRLAGLVVQHHKARVPPVQAVNTPFQGEGAPCCVKAA